MVDSDAVQVALFSPKGTYLVTWERPRKPADGSQPPGNLKVWDSETGAFLTGFSMKQAPNSIAWPAIQWSPDEKIAPQKDTNCITILDGNHWGTKEGNSIITRVKVDNVASFSVTGYGPFYNFVSFAPGSKGNASRVSLYQYPGAIEKPITAKQFFQAEEITVRWSPTGGSAIVFTSTTVDTSGKSYYGSTGLHLLCADGTTQDCAISLPKEGPVHDVQWSPRK